MQRSSTSQMPTFCAAGVAVLLAAADRVERRSGAAAAAGAATAFFLGAISAALCACSCKLIPQRQNYLTLLAPSSVFLQRRKVAGAPSLCRTHSLVQNPDESELTETATELYDLVAGWLAVQTADASLTRLACLP